MRDADAYPLAIYAPIPTDKTPKTLKDLKENYLPPVQVSSYILHV
jgi:hypothetical protein